MKNKLTGSARSAESRGPWPCPVARGSNREKGKGGLNGGLLKWGQNGDQKQRKRKFLVFGA